VRLTRKTDAEPSFRLKGNFMKPFWPKFADKNK
jgi:hypothetical protein